MYKFSRIVKGGLHPEPLSHAEGVRSTMAQGFRWEDPMGLGKTLKSQKFNFPNSPFSLVQFKAMFACNKYNRFFYLKKKSRGTFLTWMIVI